MLDCNPLLWVDLVCHKNQSDISIVDKKRRNDLPHRMLGWLGTKPETNTFSELHKRKILAVKSSYGTYSYNRSRGYAALAIFLRCSPNICLGYKTTLAFIAHDEEPNACCLKTLLNHVNFVNYF